MHSPRHPGPKCPITSTAFCSSDPAAAASKIKQPPCYEDAVKQVKQTSHRPPNHHNHHPNPASPIPTLALPAKH